jgi:hypothetical protein
MLRRFASLALTLLIAAPSVTSLEIHPDTLIDAAEVDCLLRPQEDGVRWVWDGSYCVGLIVGRLSE